MSFNPMRCSKFFSQQKDQKKAKIKIFEKIKNTTLK